MATEQDEALYWAGKAADAHHNAQDIVQASAGKWQAAIAAFLGAYATVGFVLGPTTLASLPTSFWKYVIVIVLGLAGFIGLIAVVFANKAAEGFPRVEQAIPLTGPRLAAAALDGAKRSRKLLQQAIISAAIAGTLAILGSFGILAVGLLSPTPAPTVVVSTHAGTYCGMLNTTNGAASVLLPNGKIISADGGMITVVTSCGGS